jgi:hypothetical protein
MRMPARGRYGLRMRMELASRFGRGPLQVGVIAQSQGILRKHIHVLVGGRPLVRLPRAERRGSGVRWPRLIDGALSDNTLSDLERRELDQRKKTKPSHT